MGILLDRFPHEVLSSDVELMRFNFMDQKFPVETRRVDIKVTGAGTCLGIVQWIKLELDSDARCENRPSPKAAVNGHWDHLVHRFARPRTIAPGDILSLLVRNDRSQITINLV
jgi:hypothetical protein